MFLSADDADNDEVMDSSSNEQVQSVWGTYPKRGRQTGKTCYEGKFISCSPDTDERRHGKISPIRAPQNESHYSMELSGFKINLIKLSLLVQAFFRVAFC